MLFITKLSIISKIKFMEESREEKEMKKSVDGVMIETVELNSNLLMDVGYNEERQEMLAETRRGGAYLYSKVTKEVYEGLISSATPDEFFNANIKSLPNKRVA